MDSAVVDQLVRRYRTLLFCREMCRYIKNAVSSLHDISGDCRDVPAGLDGGGSGTLMADHGVVGVGAVFQSMDDIFTEEMVRLQLLLGVYFPDFSQAEASDDGVGTDNIGR